MKRLKQIRIFDMPVSEALSKAAPYLTLAFVTALICYFFFDKISKDESHTRRLWLAAIAVVLLAYRLITKGVPFVTDESSGKKSALARTKIYFGTLTVAVVFGIFNYYSFDKKESVGIGDAADILYYYLNTKYLDELGYYSLYSAILTADKEYQNRYATRVKRYRDLRDYELKPTSVAFEHGVEIKKKFSKERWDAFKHDVDYFLAMPDMARLYNYVFSDHGYNPPPTWAVPGYALAGLVNVENIKWIAMADVVAVIAMLVAVAWAFNMEAMLFCMLFFVCTFSGRWPMLGQCLLRFDWLSALVIGICFIKKEKWAYAGAALAYAAFNRVFPAIFFFPWFVAALAEWFQTKRLPMHHVRLAGGAAVVSVFLVVTALGLFGTRTLLESKDKVLMHNESFSSHRVGLANLFIYDGETTKAALKAAGGLKAKEEKVQATRKLRNLVGLAALAFIALYIVRVRRPVHELIQLAAIPLFCVTTPQINYYNLRIILVVWHIANLKEGLFHRVGIIALFAIEVIAQWSHISGNERFATNSYTSYGLFFYYLFVMIWMGKQILDAKKNSARPPQSSV
jgi:hypothetical protein